MDLKTIKNKLAKFECRENIVRKQYIASVLIPLIPNGEGFNILFEVRSEKVSRHPGQIGFPGGSIEQGEKALDAAVREMEEELSIKKNEINVFGRLGRVESITGAVVEAFVCSIINKSTPVPDGAEVVEVFEVPLEKIIREGLKEAIMYETFTLSKDFPLELLPEKNWERKYKYPVYYFAYEGKLIWGLTAKLLKCFIDSLLQDMC